MGLGSTGPVRLRPQVTLRLSEPAPPAIPGEAQESPVATESLTTPDRSAVAPPEVSTASQGRAWYERPWPFTVEQVQAALEQPKVSSPEAIAASQIVAEPTQSAAEQPSHSGPAPDRELLPGAAESAPQQGVPPRRRRAQVDELSATVTAVAEDTPSHRAPRAESGRIDDEMVAPASTAERGPVADAHRPATEATRPAAAIARRQRVDSARPDAPADVMPPRAAAPAPASQAPNKDAIDATEDSAMQVPEPLARPARASEPVAPPIVSNASSADAVVAQNMPLIDLSIAPPRVGGEYDAGPRPTGGDIETRPAAESLSEPGRALASPQPTTMVRPRAPQLPSTTAEPRSSEVALTLAAVPPVGEPPTSFLPPTAAADATSRSVPAAVNGPLPLQRRAVQRSDVAQPLDQAESLPERHSQAERPTEPLDRPPAGPPVYDLSARYEAALDAYRAVRSGQTEPSIEAASASPAIASENSGGSMVQRVSLRSEDAASASLLEPSAHTEPETLGTAIPTLSLVRPLARAGAAVEQAPSPQMAPAEGDRSVQLQRVQQPVALEQAHVGARVISTPPMVSEPSRSKHAAPEASAGGDVVLQRATVTAPEGQGEANTSGAQAGPPPAAEVNIDRLAEEVMQRLRRRLQIEADRLGRPGWR